MGHQPTENYRAGLDDPDNQAMIYQHNLRSKMIGICINNLLTTDAKQKLKALSTAYNLSNKYDGDGMFFVIVKMVQPDTGRMLRHKV